MEEFQYKLSQNDSILTLNGVEGIVEKVRVLHQGNNEESGKYYQFLKQQCISGGHSVSNTAMYGMLKLTQEPYNVLTYKSLLSDMLSCVSYVKDVSGIIDLIFHGMLQTHWGLFDICKNTHPLIMILKKHKSAWPKIINKLEQKYDIFLKKKALGRLEPFVLYVLYDHENQMELLLQLQLMDIFKGHLDSLNKEKIMVMDVSHAMRTIKYCKILLNEGPEICAYLISGIYMLLGNDEDTTEAIWVLYQYLRDGDHNSRDFSLEIVLLSECIPLCPITHLSTMCKCLRLMLSTTTYSTLVQSIMKSSLLPWKVHFSLNQQDAQPELEKLLMLKTEMCTRKTQKEKTTELDEKMCIYEYLLCDGQELTVEYMDAISNASSHIQQKLFTFLLGTIYEDDKESDILLKAIEICLKCCENHPQLTSRLLPVLICKLSRGYCQPEVHTALLHALPKMGVLKQNLPLIVSVIQAFSEKSPEMHAFAISLMYELVIVSHMCFPRLMELFMKRATPDSKNYELDTAKAHTLLELCKRLSSNKLEIYRGELASLISKLLVQINDNLLAMSFAFEALKHLCEGIDPWSTYSNLAVRYSSDTRDRVIIGMCDIIGEIADIPGLEEHKSNTVIRELFAYADKYPKSRVLKAVYKNLSKFSIEQIIPAFPLIYAAVTNDHSVVGALAGVCWVNLLIYGPRNGLKPAANMIIKFIHETLPRNLGGEGEEPIHMQVTRDNILGAVARYAKLNYNPPSDRDVLIECLRILSVRYARPMPAMNWKFLLKLCKDPEMCRYCVDIVAHQSSVSPSCRKILEGFLDEEEYEDMLYDNLEYLCNTIQPHIMKPFFLRTLGKCGTTPKVEIALKHMRDLLCNPTASEANKSTLSETIMKALWEQDLTEAAFKQLLTVAGHVSLKYLNEYSPLLKTQSDDLDVLMKCIAVRSAAAANVSKSEHAWCFFDFIIDMPSIRDNFHMMSFEEFSQYIAPVFHKHGTTEKAAEWFSQLVAKIEFTLAEKGTMISVRLYCGFLLVGIVIASQFGVIYNASCNEYIEIFPYAMAYMLRTPAYSAYAPQFLRSMHSFATNTQYEHDKHSPLFALQFRTTLLLMRTHEAFNDKYSWLNYIEV